MREKFTGFSYQDNQKYHQEAVKYGQEVMDQASNAKGREEEATRAFNQVFQALAQKPQAGLPVTASKTRRSSRQTF